MVMTKQEFIPGFSRWIHNWNRNIGRDAVEEYWYPLCNHELSPTVQELPKAVFNHLVDIVLKEEDNFPKKKTLLHWINAAWNKHKKSQEQENKYPGISCDDCHGSAWVDFDEDFKPNRYPTGYAKPCHCSAADSIRRSLTLDSRPTAWTTEEHEYQRFRRSALRQDYTQEMIALRDQHAEDSKTWKNLNQCLKNIVAALKEF
jgi:hypothetical protein